MGSATSALIKRLSQPDAIRKQVLAYLFIAHIHNPIKLSYERYLATTLTLPEEDSQQQKKQQQKQANQSPPPASEKQHQSSTTSELSITSVGRGQRLRLRPQHRDQQGEGNHATTCDWRGFPELWRPLTLYEFASNCWMAYAGVRTLFLDQLSRLLDPFSLWLLGLPGNCLLMGRIAVPIVISQFLSALLASYHFIWRNVQERSRHNRLITMIPFLFLSKRDLEHFYALLEADELQEHLPSDRTQSTGSSSQAADGQLVLTQATAATAAAVAVAQLPRPISQTERLLRQVMCYRVESLTGSRRFYYKLRPNRTREARRQLVNHMARVTLAAAGFYCLQFIVAFSLILMNVLSDYRYVNLYPGCYPLLDERFARGELNASWPPSVTLKNHHLISGLIFDAIENTILWGESGLSLTFVPALAYLLNYDQLLYWSHLNRKLKLMLARSTQNEQQQQQKRRQQQQHHGISFPICNRLLCVPSLPIFNRKWPPSINNTHQKSDNVQQLERCFACSSSSSSSYGNDNNLLSTWKQERDIHELQAEICDFFHQSRRADLFVGDVLTMAIGIWLSYCAFFSYQQLVKSDSSVIVRVMLFLGFFVITLTSYHLFELRRRCLESHRLLCSLMAHDKTHRKHHFAGLLDFYLRDRDATTYHLCRAYAYKPATFITIIGWSFSCFFIAYSLLSAHSSNKM